MNEDFVLLESGVLALRTIIFWVWRARSEISGSRQSHLNLQKSYKLPCSNDKKKNKEIAAIYFQCRW